MFAELGVFVWLHVTLEAGAKFILTRERRTESAQLELPGGAFASFSQWKSLLVVVVDKAPQVLFPPVLAGDLTTRVVEVAVETFLPELQKAAATNSTQEDVDLRWMLKGVTSECCACSRQTAGGDCLRGHGRTGQDVFLVIAAEGWKLMEARGVTRRLKH